MNFVSHARPLRNHVSRILLDLSRRLASDDGWARLSTREGAPNMLGGLLRMQDRGFRPAFVVDVGACQGDWACLVHRAFPDCQVLMVEPQPRHHEQLRGMVASAADRLRLEPVLLGPPGMDAADFHVMDDGAGGTGSSVLPELSSVPRHAIRLPVVTLDDVLLRTGGRQVDLLKLDVQGFELEVLKGATLTLQTTPHVLLEVSVVHYNAGGPLFHEVVAWMLERGFQVAEVFDISRDRSDRLVQIDLLFSRAG